MKKFLSIPLFLCAVSAVAQNTYMNEQLLNNSEDVIGTSRFVGMGGAMGALGADLSVISWNPAGIGLFRKNDASLTFGGLWGKNSIKEESRGAATFDQIGVVFNLRTESDVCPYINFGFNYQKKKNFLSNFYADNNNLYGISQMDQLAEMATAGFDTRWNLTGLALNNEFFTETIGADEKKKYHNKYYGDYNTYTHHSDGALHSWDFNVSTNIQDRAFLGLTFGVDNLNYSSWTNYFEANSYPKDNGEEVRGDYSVYNDYRINGYGFNFKLGGIVRPFESNSFRVGFAIESPTWYKLKSDVYTELFDETYIPAKFVAKSQYPYPLDFNMRTPWKFRASMGSTVGSVFAWDVDYEYADYSDMTQRYPKYDYSHSFGGAADIDMNYLTNTTLKGVHTVRAGMEVRPVSPLAFRVGYNFTSASYDTKGQFDQYDLNSYARDYMTSTNYMITKPTHILSLGMGYKWKYFYFDLAYKIRHQKADFYAFDDTFTSSPDFGQMNPDLKDQVLYSVPLDLTRHSITCTLGIKF